MNKQNVSWQLFTGTLIASPILALLLLSPIYFIVGLKFWQYLFSSLVVTLIMIIISSFINYLFSKKWFINKPPYQRFLIYVVFQVIFCLLIIFFSITPEFLKLIPNFNSIRITNFIFFSLLIYFFYDLIIAWDRKNKENAELKIAHWEAQYKLLKGQINPHFLFNALETAKSLIPKQPELAELFIVKLSDFFRNNLTLDREESKLTEEQSMCVNYLEVLKIRFGTALNYTISINPTAEEEKVPYLSLITLAENAVKHNTLTQDFPLTIHIYTDQDGVWVNNNFQPKKFKEGSTGIGLNNLSLRHERLTGRPLEILHTTEAFQVKMYFKRA